MDKAFLDLLKKWLSGDFRRTDGERLQSMMADDDFQRESFEGFAGQSETVGERDVSAMRARFDKKYGRKKGGRTLPMGWMMAAAACGLLVFGTIWLFQETDEKMAATEPQIAMEKPAQTVENQSVEVQTDRAGQNPSAAIPPVFGEKKEGVFLQKRLDAAPEIAQKQDAEKAKSADLGQNEYAVSDENMARPRDAAPAPAVAATPSRNDSRADQQDNYQRNQNYQTVPPTLPSDYGANSKPMPKKPAATKPAAPPPGAEADGLSEIVVAAESKKEKSSKKKRDETDAKPTPVTGWPAFGEYILRNKKQPVEAQLANISGTVELKFYIDRDGRPIQILVSKKVGGGCDEEAVRLLENGPNWSPGNREARVSIDF